MAHSDAGTPDRLARLRLSAQGLARRDFASPEQVVAHLFAVQAQDYPGVLWTVGARMRRGNASAVETALRTGTVVRSWPMRGTLHLISAADLHWMLSLTSERLLRRAARRRQQLELDERLIGIARDTAVEALTGGTHLSRADLLARFDAAGVSTAQQRGYHLLWHLSTEGTLVFGAPRDRTQTFALLDEWVPAPRPLERDEALAELALRYFSGHGPATVQDLAWWSGLPLGDVRAGVAAAGDALESITVDGATHLLAPGAANARPRTGTVRALSGFDELLLGYRDRTAQLAAEHSTRVIPGGNGMFAPTITVDGRVVGTWRRETSARGIRYEARPFEPLTDSVSAALDEEFARHAAFHDSVVAT